MLSLISIIDHDFSYFKVGKEKSKGFLFLGTTVAQSVKNSPAMLEIWVRSLGWEDPLEEGVATHSSILAWRIPMGRGAWRATVQLQLHMTE